MGHIFRKLQELDLRSLQRVRNEQFQNNLRCKQNHAFAQQAPICEPFRLSEVNARDYIICALLKIAGRGHDRLHVGIFIARAVILYKRVGTEYVGADLAAPLYLFDLAL